MHGLIAIGEMPLQGMGEGLWLEGEEIGQGRVGHGLLEGGVRAV